MARGKGKRGKRGGGGSRFAAQSAEEIEQRNARLAEFDAARAKRREDADNDDDGSVDSAQREAEREAMEVGRRVAGMSVGGGDEGEEDDGDWVEKEYKPKGVEALIEVDNPNKAPVKMIKMKDMGSGEAAPMTRKEREEKEKEAKAAAYRKRHELGLTEEYKRDMAKLEEVKARRAAAQAKVADENSAADAIEAARKAAAEAAMAGDDDEDGGKKKKKKGKEAIPKLDKIAIKKMKPAALKEALKERGLDIQGNSKLLTQRLVDFEKDR